MELTFRFAEAADTPLILEFIKKLADYEHMLDQVVADEVRLIEDDERAAKKKNPTVSIRQNADRALRASASRELDIRGMETLEAESVVENFLSAAVMGRLDTVTIIHGKGTGALRKAVHDILRRNKAVKSFRLGVYGEGESGVTVVTMK